MASSPTWIGIIGLIFFLGLMSGFWAGIAGLWKARRSAAWWMMAIGIAFLTIGPLLYGLGLWTMMSSFRAGATGSSTFPTGSTITLMASGLLIPVGLLLFSIGFALHGFAAARAVNRAEELDQLAAAMSEEINRLRGGGPVA